MESSPCIRVLQNGASDDYGDDDDEQQMAESFLITPSSSSKRGVSTSVLVVLINLLVLVSVVIAYFGLETTRQVKAFLDSPSSLPNNNDTSQNTLPHNHPESSRLVFDCPDRVMDDHDQNPHSVEHQDADLEILQHTADYLQNFRALPFDFWSLTYEEYKAAMVPWKQRLMEHLLLPTTGNDIAIYESASGLGLNLLLTAEIWYETQAARGTITTAGINNVKLYGNDYVAESVQLARTILQDETIMSSVSGDGSRIAQYGQVCRGDSTQLHDWVPPESFDLVYTGFITPLQDPLNLGLSQYELEDIYADICKSSQPDRQQQAQLLQQRQEDWFALWVQEMLRLAKPGAVVGVEMISYPQCDDLEEWGGVDKAFWHTDRYGWDVDPASVVIRDANHMPGRRYHALMRKNL